MTATNPLSIITALMAFVIGLLLILFPNYLLKNKNIDTKNKIKHTATLYRFMGVIGLFIAVINLQNLGKQLFINPSTVVSIEYVDWVRSPRTTIFLDEHLRTSFRAEIPIYTSDSKQIYVYFFTKSLKNEDMRYQWTVNGKLKRDFTVKHKNGDNYVALKDADNYVILKSDFSEVFESGDHEVHMSRDEEKVALLRFKVK